MNRRIVKKVARRHVALIVGAMSAGVLSQAPVLSHGTAGSGPAGGSRAAALSSSANQAAQPNLAAEIRMAAQRLPGNLASPHPGRPEALVHPDADHMTARRPSTASGPASTPGVATLTATSVPAAVTAGNALGLDVSSYQGNVDWNTARANGATFAYIKATEGTYYTSSAYFPQQYNGSYNAGLVRGAYHFAIPNNSTGAAQADWFVGHGGGWSPDGKTLPGTLDIEYNPYGAECYGLTGSQMVGWVQSFDNEYKLLTGRHPTIYTTTGWWSACTGNSSGFNQNALALASFASTPGTLPASWPSYTIWQYADAGVFPGDQDVFNGSTVQLGAFAVSGATPVSISSVVSLTCPDGGDLRTPSQARVQPGVVVRQTSNGATSYLTYTIASSGQLQPIPTSAPSASTPLVAVWQNSTDCNGSPTSRNAWTVTPNGTVYAESTESGPPTKNFGDTSQVQLNKPVVGMSPTGDANGYWLVASDGGIFSYGDSHFYGSTGAVTLNKPVVGMATSPDSGGYWLVATDGGIFAFGDARFYGSLGGIQLVRPVEAMVATADGRGYWMVASDGGVFCFGDAGFHGSMGGHVLSAPIAGMVPNGSGYTLIGQDGRTYPFS